MRRMLFLALALAMMVTIAGALSTTPRAEAASGSSCPICTTYADGSQCCVPCWCDSRGRIIACTNVYCPPADPGN